MEQQTHQEQGSKLKSTLESTLRLVLNKTPRGLRRGPLWGMAAQLEASNFMTSAEDKNVVNTLGKYQVTLNDLLDFEGANRPELQDILTHARSDSVKAKSNLDAAIDKITDPNKQTEIRRLIENSVTELSFAERYVRSGAFPITLDSVDQYRNVVNAINEVVDLALVLGTSDFQARLGTIPDNQLSWDALYEKYRWVFEGQFQNDSQKYTIMLHNLAMAAQLVDDWHDTDIDGLLNIPSFGAVAMKTYEGDKVMARQEVARRIRTYKNKAHSVTGLGYFSQQLFISGLNWFKSASNFAMRQAKYGENSRIKAGFAKFVRSTLGQREQQYVTGKLDLLHDMNPQRGE